MFDKALMYSKAAHKEQQSIANEQQRTKQVNNYAANYKQTRIIVSHSADNRIATCLYFGNK